MKRLQTLTSAADNLGQGTDKSHSYQSISKLQHLRWLDHQPILYRSLHNYLLLQQTIILRGALRTFINLSIDKKMEDRPVSPLEMALQHLL